MPSPFLQVGEYYKKNKTVTIAKMDATANDVPDGRFQVSQTLSRRVANNTLPFASGNNAR